MDWALSLIQIGLTITVGAIGYIIRYVQDSKKIKELKKENKHRLLITCFNGYENQKKNVFEAMARTVDWLKTAPQTDGIIKIWQHHNYMPVMRILKRSKYHIPFQAFQEQHERDVLKEFSSLLYWLNRMAFYDDEKIYAVNYNVKYIIDAYRNDDTNRQLTDLVKLFADHGYIFECYHILNRYSDRSVVNFDCFYQRVQVPGMDPDILAEKEMRR